MYGVESRRWNVAIEPEMEKKMFLNIEHNIILVQLKVFQLKLELDEWIKQEFIFFEWASNFGVM